MGQAKNRGTREERVRQAQQQGKTKKTHYTAKELFGKASTEYTEDGVGGFSTGKHLMWDAARGKGPFAIFTVPHETQKLIDMMEKAPVQYSTCMIKEDWDAVLPEITRPRHDGDMVAGYFLAILPTFKHEEGDRTQTGLITRDPDPGYTDAQWSEHLDQIRNQFTMVSINDRFAGVSCYCTPDKVWDLFRSIVEHFHFAIVAFSNTIKLQVLAESAIWQRAWNTGQTADDVVEWAEGGPFVARQLNKHKEPA